MASGSLWERSAATPEGEEKLQQINDAYRVLQSPPTPNFTRGSYAEPSAPAKKYGASLSRMIAAWILGGLGIAAVVVVALLAFTHDWSQSQAPAVTDTQPQVSTGAGKHVESSPQKAPKAPLKDASRSNQTAQFRVHQLSEAEAAQLESACPKAMEVRDPSGYQDCVRAQLEPSAPDMSALSAEDRAGIESACTRTKVREVPLLTISA